MVAFGITIDSGGTGASGRLGDGILKRQGASCNTKGEIRAIFQQGTDCWMLRAAPGNAHHVRAIQPGAKVLICVYYTGYT